MVNEVDFRRFRQAFNVSVKKEFADDEMVSFCQTQLFVSKFCRTIYDNKGICD